MTKKCSQTAFPVEISQYDVKVYSPTTVDPERIALRRGKRSPKHCNWSRKG